MKAIAVLMAIVVLLSKPVLGFDNTPPLDSNVTTKAVQALDPTTSPDKKPTTDDDEPLVSSGTLALVAIPSCVLVFAIVSLAMVLSVVPTDRLPLARRPAPARLQYGGRRRPRRNDNNSRRRQDAKEK